MARILIVDDDAGFLDSFAGFLKQKGHQVHAANDLGKAVALFREHRHDLVALDIYLSGSDGFAALPELTRAGASVVMVSGNADVASAVRAVKEGAIDLLEKPVDPARLDVLIAQAERANRIAGEAEAFREAWKEENLYYAPESTLATVVAAAERVAGTPLSVLLRGPSGAGKEPLARWIALCSPRSAKPFVTVNCSAIPDELAESELFGHVKGAFTGADRERPGFFRQADGGTLFLDEIGDVSPRLQPKLLRVLENREIRPVGTDAPAHLDVRVIAATNRDLQAEVAAGRYREDLLYRLSQMVLEVPPLDTRRGDIGGLARMFASRMAGHAGVQTAKLTENAVSFLSARTYGGNVRELKSLVERAVVMAEGPEITEEDLRGVVSIGTNDSQAPFQETLPYQEAKRRLELRYLETQIAKFNGSVKAAAAALEILPNNLSRRLRELRSSLPPSSNPPEHSRARSGPADPPP